MYNSDMRHHLPRRLGSITIAGILTASSFTLGWSSPALAAPANDDWANATDVSSLVPPPFDPALPGVSVTGTTAGATREAGEPVVDGAAALGTVWFRYTAPAGSRLGQLGFRVTDRSAFVAAAYSPYVQIANPLPYPGEDTPTLSGMNRVLTTGYAQWGTLPGDTAAGFLPTVRVEPGATVWFQVSANPTATPPTDGAFTLELFSVGDYGEDIGRTQTDLSCTDPFGCSGGFWGDTSAASPAAVASADTWAQVIVPAGTPLTVVVRSQNSGFRASTRPVSVSVYLHPAGVPPTAPIADIAQLGAPIASDAGAVELVDGSDFGMTGTVNQWVARVPNLTAGTVYHLRVQGDPSFVGIEVSTPPRNSPTATITDPSDGAAFASPADVPALAYTCTPGNAPISSSAVTVDGVAVPANQPLPTAAGAHTIRVVCVDANGAQGEATATYSVAVQFEAPNQALTVDEDSTVTADLLAAVTAPIGQSAVLTSVGSPSHGTVSVVGGTVTYTPFPDYAGPDQFSYTVTSSAGETRTAAVDVTVNPVNDAPIAVDDTLTVNAGSTLEINHADLVGNDTDIDGGSLSVSSASIVSPSIGGQLRACGTSRPTCSLYVAPTTSGVEIVDYVVSDGAGGTDVGRLRITVVPTALPDTVLVTLSCPSGFSYTVGGPTTGLSVTRGPFGITLISGVARVGTAEVRIGLVVMPGGAAIGTVWFFDSPLFALLRPRSAEVAIGSTWVMSGVWWRQSSTPNGLRFERCSFQVNVTDGG
jgi:hypothetical protein